MAELVLCKKVACFFHSLTKQMLVLDKIFTVSKAVPLLSTRSATINNQLHKKWAKKGFVLQDKSQAVKHAALPQQRNI